MLEGNGFMKKPEVENLVTLSLNCAHGVTTSSEININNIISVTHSLTQITVIWIKFVRWRKRNRLENTIHRNTFFGNITQIK
jgi:hypothetical protein